MKKFMLLLGAAIALLACDASSQVVTDVSSTTTGTTPVPTKIHTAKIIQTLTGNGTKKGAVITVPNDWKLSWTCDPSSFYGGSYNLIVGVMGSDGSYIDPAAVNTMCKSGNTSDSTEEHQGGSIYLDVNSEGKWTITVQAIQ